MEEKKKYLFSRRDFIGLVLPLMADFTLMLLVGVVDSMMVASVGEDAVSGVSLVDNVIQLLILVFTAFGTGGAVVAGQYLGAKDERTACATTTELIWFSGLVSVVIMAIILMVRNFLLHGLFGNITPEVFGHAQVYMLIVALSIPALALYQAGAAIFRAMGQAKLVMRMSIIMNLINLCGNALFIYGFQWGSFGAGLSTTIARTAAAVAAMGMLLNPERVLHLKPGFRYRPNSAIIRKILFIGVPNGVENGLFQLGKLLVIRLIAQFGTASIAAHSIAMTLVTIELIPGKTMDLATTTIIARCVGAGDEEQTRFYNRVIQGVSYGALALTCIGEMLLLPWILKLYNISPEAYTLTWKMVVLHSTVAIALWSSSFVLPSALRAAGDVRFAMLVSIASMWIFRIGGSYLLAHFTSLGAIGVWVAMECDWAARSACFLYRWHTGGWKGKSVVGKR